MWIVLFNVGIFGFTLIDVVLVFYSELLIA